MTTDYPVTIPKNHKKKIAVIRERVTHVRAYSQSSGEMIDTTADRAFKALYDYDFAKLVDRGKGRYTVRVHSNLWYDLTVPNSEIEKAG